MQPPIPFKKFIPGIAWFFVVLFLICLPKTDMPELDNWLAILLKKIEFDKWVHAFMFGLMAFLFISPFGKADFSAKRKKYFFLQILFLVSCWGLATECIQLYVPGRDFDWLDWAADTLGAGIAFLYCRKHYLLNIS